jgi:hypothetical protein
VTKPNDILRNLSRWIVENPFITTNNAHTAFMQITYLEKEIWQAKGTLNQLVAKQKTWDQKEENQVAPQEQESSTPSNDQRLPEKEQSQRTARTNKKQYIISYPPGYSVNVESGETKDNSDIAADMINSLREGFDITIPNTFKLQVIDL